MRRFLLIALIAALPCLAQAKPLHIVASFSVLGDLVKQVGGDEVTVTTLVGPNGDTHEYEPKPSDAQALADADLVVMNGLGLEGWMDRLREASGYKGPFIIAAQGLPILTKEGSDPHAWQSVQNAIRYVDVIESALTKFAGSDERTPVFIKNADDYRAKLKALDSEVRASFAPIPQEKRIVITTHDAFGYYGQEYGIRFLAPEGISTESEPTPQAIANLISQIKQLHVSAVFIENMTDPRLVKQIASEARVDVTGELFSDALSPPDGPASTYIDMLRYNTAMLSKSLTNH